MRSRTASVSILATLLCLMAACAAPPKPEFHARFALRNLNFTDESGRVVMSMRFGTEQDTFIVSLNVREFRKAIPEAEAVIITDGKTSERIPFGDRGRIVVEVNFPVDLERTEDGIR